MSELPSSRIHVATLSTQNRTNIDVTLDKFHALIDVKDYSRARELFAKFIRCHFTGNTIEQLQDLFWQVPAEEWPLLMTQRKVVAYVEDVYGVNTDAMSLDEVKDFMTNVFDGDIRPKEPAKYSYYDMTLLYAYLTMKHQFNEQDALEVFSTAVDATTKRLLCAPSDPTISSDQQLLLTTIDLLGECTSLDAFLKLVDIGELCIRRGFYDQEYQGVVSEQHVRFVHVLTSVFDAFANMFSNDHKRKVLAQPIVVNWEIWLAAGNASRLTRKSIERLQLQQQAQQQQRRLRRPTF